MGRILAGLLLLCLAMDMMYLGSAAVGIFRTFPSHGVVIDEDLMVWEDAAGTIPLVDLDFDYPRPGGNVTVIVYVQNMGNWPARITIRTSEWVPVEASTYMNLVTYYLGEPIPPMAIIPLYLQLRVHSDVTGITAFSFTILIDIEAVIPPD